MEEKEIRVKDNSSKKFIIIIIALALVIVGMGFYIAYSKGIIFSNASVEENNSKNKKKVNTSTDTKDDDVIKNVDLTKCLNNKTNSFSELTDVEGNYGLSMNINDNKTSITLSIDWNKFGPISLASAWAPSVETYQITGFNKKVSSTYVGSLGQDAMGITLFYIMEDGTVEYTPVFVSKRDTQNISYYEINYTYEYSTDNRITGQHFETKGALNGVSNVIKLYDVSNGNGLTTIGALKDGSFYDLGHIVYSLN